MYGLRSKMYIANSTTDFADWQRSRTYAVLTDDEHFLAVSKVMQTLSLLNYDGEDVLFRADTAAEVSRKIWRTEQFKRRTIQYVNVRVHPTEDIAMGALSTLGPGDRGSVTMPTALLTEADGVRFTKPMDVLPAIDDNDEGDDW